MLDAHHERLCFGVASTDAEKERIYELRRNNYVRRERYLLGDGRASDRFDEGSYLFFLEAGERLAATSRVTPYSTACELSTFALPADLSRRFDRQYIQYSRVLVDGAYRNQKLHVLLFHHVAAWLLDHTDHRYYVSVCRGPLLRLYGHFGARVASAEHITISGRQSPYYLIEGAIETARDLSARMLQHIRHGAGPARRHDDPAAPGYGQP